MPPPTLPDPLTPVPALPPVPVPVPVSVPVPLVVPVELELPMPVPAEPFTPSGAPLSQVPVVPAVPVPVALPFGETGCVVVGEGEDGVMVPPAEFVLPVVMPGPFKVPLPDIEGVVLVLPGLVGAAVVPAEPLTLPEVLEPVPMLCAHAPPAASAAASMNVDFFIMKLLRYELSGT